MRCAVVFGLFIGALLSGCASKTFSIRSLPPENPAAENAAAAESAAKFAAAASTASAEPSERNPGLQDSYDAPPVTAADAPSMRTYDPWERLNRFTYRFNARFDEAVFFPVANAYRRVPSPVRSGVHNFFGNLAEVGSVINYALQWRIKLGVRSLSRFA